MITVTTQGQLGVALGALTHFNPRIHVLVDDGVRRRPSLWMGAVRKRFPRRKHLALLFFPLTRCYGLVNFVIPPSGTNTGYFNEIVGLNSHPDNMHEGRPSDYPSENWLAILLNPEMNDPQESLRAIDAQRHIARANIEAENRQFDDYVAHLRRKYGSDHAYVRDVECGRIPLSFDEMTDYEPPTLTDRVFSYLGKRR